MAADAPARERSAATFVCKADSTDVLTTLLSTLLWDKNQVVLVNVTAAGMKFTVEKDKCVKAKAYLKSSCFQEYSSVDAAEEIEFTLSLSVFLDCLQVFGVACHMQLAYNGYGSDVQLLLEDDGVITQCELRTLDEVTPAEFSFRSSNVTARTVIKSGFLKECFAELDIPGATTVSLFMSPQAPYLSMSVKGDTNTVEIDFPSDRSHSEVFTEFDCKEKITNTYSLSLIRPCVKALAKAEHTNLRMNEEGMLSMQHVIPTKDGALTNWVEFLLCAQEDT